MRIVVVYRVIIAGRSGKSVFEVYTDPEKLIGESYRGTNIEVTKEAAVLFNFHDSVYSMRIEDKDEKGEGYLVVETKEDLEEFGKMLIEAYYELNPDRKHHNETK